VLWFETQHLAVLEETVSVETLACRVLIGESPNVFVCNDTNTCHYKTWQCDESATGAASQQSCFRDSAIRSRKAADAFPIQFAPSRPSTIPPPLSQLPVPYCAKSHVVQQSPSCITDSRSAGQEVPKRISISKDHYRAHKSPLLGPILSHMNPIHTLAQVL
jgi:hypothetical protein